MSEYQPMLHVYVVYRPDADGDPPGPKRHDLATSLYGHLCRDTDRPLDRGLGIPVYFRSAGETQEASLPLPIALERAGRTAVIVLAESGMVPPRTGWEGYLDETGAGISASGGRHLLLPVALDENAHLLPPLGGLQPIRLALEEPDQERKLLTAVSNALVRFLKREPEASGTVVEPPKPVRLFISHAKRDGRGPAEEFKKTVDRLPADRFFDEVNIAEGYEWTNQIETAVKESVMLVLLTDAYSSRPWCRREVVRAKRHQRPVVVLDMLEKLDMRMFPYLGNAPVIRWTGAEHEEGIHMAMSEALRFEYHLQRLKGLRDQGWFPEQAMLLPRVPEPADCVDLLPIAADAIPRPSLMVYPDPPLGPEETQLLSGLRPATTFTTPSASTAYIGQMLKRIGISISRSPDLPRLGFSETHLHDVMTEIARHLLVRGNVIAYGGYHDKKEFADRLFELVESYLQTGTAALSLIKSYLAWPLSRSLTLQQEAPLRNKATVHTFPLPTDLQEASAIDHDTLFDLQNADSRYIWARCLTEMRTLMNDEIDARLVMGGPVEGYRGKYPGLLEEVYLALRVQKPVYLLGAFGGCAGAIIEAVKGGTPLIFSETRQIEDPVYAEMAQRYNRDAADHQQLGLEPIDYTKVVSLLQERGVAGLNNGLSEVENARLFETADPDEIVYLTLKGLSAVR